MGWNGRLQGILIALVTGGLSLLSMSVDEFCEIFTQVAEIMIR